MKTATFPSLRVEPALRDAAESVLRPDETLSGLIESAVRETVERRQAQAAFVERGLRAARRMQRDGTSHAAKDVHAEVRRLIAARRKQTLG